MTRFRTRSIVAPIAAAALAVVASGCGSTAGPSGASSAPANPRPTERPAATATGPAGIPNSAILLVARPGSDGWTIVEAATGGGYLGPDFRVPVGAARPGWGRIITATAKGDRTVVRDSVNDPDFAGPSLELDGRWQLPTVGRDPMPVGVSPDGSTIVLVEAAPATTAATTRFAIVQHLFDGKPSTVGDADLRLIRTVELRGRFAYDTLSEDGRVLYVIEHLDASEGGHYQVRAVDLPAGTLRDAVIVDKSNLTERMAGYPIAQLRRSDGVVMTLYDGPEHPFIHALQAAEGWAICIDLPATKGAERAGWGLTAGPDGRTVYAANGAAGVVVEVDPDEYAVSRIGALAPSTAGSITLAKFGHSDVGPTGRRVVALPDGKGLLVATDDGVAIVNGKDLREGGRIATGAPVDAIGVTPDESLGFALTRDGRIVAFEPRAGGRTFGAVANGPYSGLIAVAPW